MKYKVKWIEDHMGITRNMIRRYKKKGVISKNEEGKDREFDEEGLRQLWDIRVLVSLGFSLDEVKEIMSEGNLKELSQKKLGEQVRNVWIYKVRLIIKDAYDEIDYDEWYDVHSDAYDIWYDTRSDIYDFQFDLRSEVYDHDDERVQKKMDKFKKSILRMKEDVNDQRESIIFSNFFKNELASLNIVVYSKQACVGECVTVRITTAQDKIQEERLMSKKKVTKVCKLQFQAGGAKPGPALASAGINMPQFCTAFNDATKDRKGDIVPVVITAYEDKSFDFVLKTTPAANLLKKAANVQKASGDQKVVAGTITVDQLKEIAEYKMPDLNANDVEAAMRIVAGTARNMGIKVEGFEQEEHQ